MKQMRRSPRFFFAPLRRLWCVLLGVLLLLRGFTAESWAQQPLAQPSGPASVIVVFNKRAPGSEELARYYARQRTIPEENVIGLDCSTDEEISREEYQRDIALPLRNALIERRFWLTRGLQVRATRVRYAAVMRGVPLKIRSDLPPPQPGEERHPVNDRDEASVDSELAVLGTGLPPKGALKNPYFQDKRPGAEGAPVEMLMVCRLDAADDSTVRRMIDDALRAERRGLWGWSYVDERGILTGPYSQGDEWLRRAADGMRRQGLPVQTERFEELWPAGYPAAEAAVYYGWYAENITGMWAAAEAAFLPGAVAVHIHSFSAVTLRDAGKGWAAPLLARGAAVTAGNVYEPYLSLTLHLDVFQERLMEGRPLAEAAYGATPVLSWMGVVLGDPLYRPYAAMLRMSPERLLKGDEWQQFCEVVRSRGGDWVAAAPLLKALGKSLHNPMPLMAVGMWQWDRGELGSALRDFSEAQGVTIASWQRVQLAWNMAKVLETQGKIREARDILGRALREEMTPAERSLLVGEEARLSASSSPAGRNAPR